MSGIISKLYHFVCKYRLLWYTLAISRNKIMAAPDQLTETPDRFDRFTDKAKQVLSLALAEAQRFNHNYIGTEHLLLGFLRVEDSMGSKILSNLGVECDKVRSAVEYIIGHDSRPNDGPLWLTGRAKLVIELAADEARRLGHHYIGTEHLLLGMVREGEGIAAGVLDSLGATFEKVRTAVASWQPDDKTEQVDENKTSLATTLEEWEQLFDDPNVPQEIKDQSLHILINLLRGAKKASNQ